jgi:hypothetical protein
LDESSSRFRSSFEDDLSGKSIRTFPDHAPGARIGSDREQLERTASNDALARRLGIAGATPIQSRKLRVSIVSLAPERQRCAPEELFRPIGSLGERCNFAAAPSSRPLEGRALAHSAHFRFPPNPDWSPHASAAAHRKMPDGNLSQFASLWLKPSIFG